MVNDLLINSLSVNGKLNSLSANSKLQYDGNYLSVEPCDTAYYRPDQYNFKFNSSTGQILIGFTGKCLTYVGRGLSVVQSNCTNSIMQKWTTGTPNQTITSVQPPIFTSRNIINPSVFTLSQNNQNYTFNISSLQVTSATADDFYIASAKIYFNIAASMNTNQSYGGKCNPAFSVACILTIDPFNIIEEHYSLALVST